MDAQLAWPMQQVSPYENLFVVMLLILKHGKLFFFPKGS